MFAKNKNIYTMSLGKAAKQKRNLDRIIQPKLDARIRTKEFKKEFESVLKDKVNTYKKKGTDVEVENKFQMFVYSHPLLGGREFSKSQWTEWINNIHDNDK